MISASNQKENNLLESLKLIIPDLYSLLVVDNGGNLLSYYVSYACADKSCFSELKNIAKLVSIRFKIGNFHQLFGGLQMTINEFRNHYMIVKDLTEETILVLIVPLQSNLLEISSILRSFGKLLLIDQGKNHFDSSVVLKRISSEVTEFQKNQEKLQHKKYTLVANPLKSESEYWNQKP